MRVTNREFQRELTEEYELDKQRIESMSRNELFDYVLEYEGYGRGAGYSIRNLVKIVYGIDLSKYRDYLPQDELEKLEGWNEE